MFEGTAICFDSEEAMLEKLSEDPSVFKGTVIIIRYEGPKVRHIIDNRNSVLLLSTCSKPLRDVRKRSEGNSDAGHDTLSIVGSCGPEIYLAYWC